MQAFVGSDSAKLPRNYTILRHDDAELLSSSISIPFDVHFIVKSLSYRYGSSH